MAEEIEQAEAYELPGSVRATIESVARFMRIGAGARGRLSPPGHA